MASDRCPDLNHFGTFAERSERLFSSPYRAGKYAWQHDALNGLFASCINDVKQTVTELNLWRFIHEKTGILAHASLPFTGRESATAKARPAKLNAALRRCAKSSSTIEPHIAFAGGVRRAAVCPNTETAARFLLAGA